MNSLFDKAPAPPLAEALRPTSLEEVIGQEHLLNPGKPLQVFVQNQRIPNLIFWGPPGCGKTTLARLLADVQPQSRFITASALHTTVGDLRKIFDQARSDRQMGMTTVLFVDEIHRFNKAQQDSFLPVMEAGTITLIGATTENPSFSLNDALLSRSQVLTLHSLEPMHLLMLLQKAEAKLETPLPLTEEARERLAQLAQGDGRALINMVETLSQVTSQEVLDPEALQSWIQRRAPLYDKGQDQHYNLISALHKSLRGSDPDAALYWFARMLDGGEDPRYIARRLIRFASEDVGLADPQALVQAESALKAYEILGSPEGELNIAQAVVYLATAPKSNGVYKAFKQALAFAKDTSNQAPPKHILNAPTKWMKEEGFGEGYHYDHDTPEGFSGDSYWPENLSQSPPRFYNPPERGFERDIQKRLMYWEKLRKKVG